MPPSGWLPCRGRHRAYHGQPTSGNPDVAHETTGLRCSDVYFRGLSGGLPGVNSIRESPSNLFTSLTCSVVSIVSCNRVRKEHVFALRTTADIVYDQGPLPVWRFLLGDDSDVREVVCDYPSDQISGSIVFCLGRDRENHAFAGEEGPKIQNPPMIDVRVRLAEGPVARKRLEVALHFFVDIPLEIDPEFTIGPDDEVCADTDIARDVTIGIGD